MVLTSVAGLAVDGGELVAGAVAWTAGVAMLPGLGVRQRRVVSALALLGVLGILASVAHGHAPDWAMMLSANQMLISLLVSVSFLRLVAGTGAGAGSRSVDSTGGDPSRAAARGKRAVWRSMLGIHLLGAVINISVLDIVGERILRSGENPKARILLISRAFSSAGFWSPFWGAAAAVFTYAPRARLSIMLLVGGVAAACGLAVSSMTVIRSLGAELRSFEGYPFSLDAVAVPLSLVAAVLVVHVALPEAPVAGVIMVCSLAITLLVLLRRGPGGMVAALKHHAVTRLPRMDRELTLFLAAGILAAGFVDVTQTFGPWTPFTHFRAIQAFLLLTVMVIASLVGIHPVITIAAAAGFLQPIHPNPTLFAMTGLFAWAIQAAGAPLSGLNVVMHGRFGVDSFTLARWNAKYAAGCLVLAAGLLPACQLLSTGGR